MTRHHALARSSRHGGPPPVDRDLLTGEQALQPRADPAERPQLDPATVQLDHDPRAPAEGLGVTGEGDRTVHRAERGPHDRGRAGAKRGGKHEGSPDEQDGSSEHQSERDAAGAEPPRHAEPDPGTDRGGDRERDRPEISHDALQWHA